MKSAYEYTGDLATLVAIHAVAFPGFYLTRMGPRFLSAYYQSVRDYHGGILLGVDDADGLAGFVVGFDEPASFYRFYRSRTLRLLPPFLIGIGRDPGLVARSWHNLRRTRQRAQIGAASRRDECELASIAVAPRAAGQGLGKVLVDAFCAEASRRGAQAVVLTTDRDDNEAVNRFYRRLGFDVRGELTSGGRPMLEYCRSVGGAGSVAP